MAGGFASHDTSNPVKYQQREIHTNDGFLYLLSLSVDLFGLINSGFAKDMKTPGEKDY